MATLTNNLKKLEEIEGIIQSMNNTILFDDSICSICDTSITTKTTVKSNYFLVADKVRKLLFNLENQPCEICLFNQGIGLCYVHQLNEKDEYSWEKRVENEELWLEINNTNTIKIIRISNVRYLDGLEILLDNDVEEEIEVSLNEIDIINKIINGFLR